MPKLLAPLALALTALPAAATAQDIHVRSADLDLASPAGVAELDRRIDQAVKTVCPPDTSIELARQAVVARCRRVMMSSVATQRERVVAQANLQDGTSLSAR